MVKFTISWTCVDFTFSRLELFRLDYLYRVKYLIFNDEDRGNQNIWFRLKSLTLYIQLHHFRMFVIEFKFIEVPYRKSRPGQ